MIQSANATIVKQTAEKSLTRLIEADADTLSAQLQHLRARAFPPTAQKELRKFAPGEAAKLIGISDVYLRTLVNEGVIGEAEKNAAGRRLYSLEQIHSIRNGFVANISAG